MGKRAPAPPSHALWITCSCGKRSYFTRALAKRAVAELRAKGQAIWKPVHVYRCDLPSADPVFHVGHYTPGPDLNSPDPKESP